MKPSLTTVVIVPHTHWDREWYQQEHLFRQRLVETVQHVLTTLETVPDFSVFLLDGQAGIIDDYLAVRPEDETRINQLARDGRLLLGPWYVLADEFLATDETLVRNLMLGKLAGERYGNWMPIGYCPDSFGHPANLPAILNGFGIERAILWRGYGGRAGQSGDLFRWNGVGTGSLLVCHLAPAGYELGAELPVGEEAARERWQELRGVLEPRTHAGHALLPSGADHHDIQPNLLAAVEAMGRIAPDVQFNIGSPTQYFDELPEHALGDLPVVTGELRFSYGYAWTLQGVHSTRSRIKRRAAEAERMLVRWAEPQCALAFVTAGVDRRALIHDTWKEFLRSCAHDSIGGCCTDAVAREVEGRFDRAASAARNLFQRAVWDRMGQDPTMVRRERDKWTPRLIVINPSPQERTGVVEALITFFRADIPVGGPVALDRDNASPTDRVFHLVASDGGTTSVQVLHAYVGHERLDSPRDYPDQDLVDVYRVAFVGQAPSLGATAYRIVEGNPPPRKAEDQKYDIKIVNGRLLSPVIKVSSDDRAFAVRDDATRVRHVADLMSERDDGDTYTFQPRESDVPLTAQWGKLRTVWRGPIVGCVARDFQLGARTRGTVYARVSYASRIVQWIIEGVNNEGNHRLRVLFPLPVGASENAIADQHFGHVNRSRETHDVADFPMEHPVRSAPCHQFVSVRGTHSGLTVFTRGTFEYELMDEHLAVTLFRAVGDLSKGNLTARPGHAAWPVPTPEAQELGYFRLELGMTLLGLSDTVEPAKWDEFGSLLESFHAPLAGMMFRQAVQPPGHVPGPMLEGAGLVFKSLKPSVGGDAVVFRCVNVTNVATSGAIEWPATMARAARCRLDELIECEVELQSGRRVIFEAAPHEIVSFLFWA